jgi:hypothetical protein
VGAGSQPSTPTTANASVIKMRMTHGYHADAPLMIASCSHA